MNFFHHLIYLFDRAFSGKGWKQIVSFLMLAIVLFVVILTLSYLFIPIWDDGKDHVSRVYQLICFFTGTNPIPNSAAGWRIFAWFVALIGSVIFCGSVISVISNMLERRVESFRRGQVSYKMKNHVVIIGFNDMVPALIKQLLNNPLYDDSILLVQSELPSEKVRNSIHIQIPEIFESRIIVLNAKRNSLEELEKLYTIDAKELFIIGENKEFDHDSLNIDCLSKIAEIHKRHSTVKLLPVTVWFDSQSTFTAFQAIDISHDWRNYFEFKPINFHNEWAKRILLNNHCDNKITYPNLDYRAINKDSEHYVHLVVVGMSSMGYALATEAAQLLHFPNFTRNPNKKTIITFIDLNADTEMEFFMRRYSHFFEICSTVYYDYSSEEILTRNIPASKFEGGNSDFLDIRFEFIKANIASSAIHKEIDKWAKSENELLSIALCLPEPQKCIAISMCFPDSVYDNNVPVFVRTSSSEALIRAINPVGGAKMKYSNLYPFGMLENSYVLDNDNLKMAQKIHYIFVEFYKKNEIPQTLPNAQELRNIWYKLSIAHQWSNLYNVYSIPFKIRNIGLPDENNKELLANVEHNRWLMEKLLLGYRKPSESELQEILTDENKKAEYRKRFVHKDIVPYSQLDKESKGKNIALTQGITLITPKLS